MKEQSRSTLIRRLRDAQGVLVTYLPNAEACRIVGISPTTLASWTQQGLVRHTDRLNGGRNYALVDMAHIKQLGTKGCRALGIQLTPDAKLAAQRAWYREMQDETRGRAAFHGEVWDDYDIKFLCESLAAGKSVEIIAKALGRTYAATADRIDTLVAAGDLPAHEHDEAWMARVTPLLTAHEIAILEADQAAA